MPRYIDADEAVRLSKEDKLAWVYDLTDLEEFLVGVPTADVVPTIELDAMRSAANSYKMHYESAKAEVIDEFVSRLKERLYTIPTVYNSHFGRIVDAVAKDMKGDKDTDDGDIVKDPEHRCMFCQEIVPQGIDVCPKCEKERG